MTDNEINEAQLRQALNRAFDGAAPSPDFEARVMDTVGTRSRPWRRVPPLTVWGIAAALVVGIGLGAGVALRGTNPVSGPAGQAGHAGVATGSPSTSLFPSQSPSPMASPTSGGATRPSSAPPATSTPGFGYVRPTALPDGTPPCTSKDVTLVLRTDQPAYTGSTVDHYGMGNPLGQPITFIVTVTNASNHACALVNAYANATGGAEPYMACVDVTATTNGDPEYQGETDRPCPQVGSRIEPGGTETALHTWNQGGCQMGRCTDSFGPASPGHYTATAQFVAGGYYEAVPPASAQFDITPPPSPSPTGSPAPSTTPTPSPAVKPTSSPTP